MLEIFLNTKFSNNHVYGSSHHNFIFKNYKFRKGPIILKCFLENLKYKLKEEKKAAAKHGCRRLALEHTAEQSVKQKAARNRGRQIKQSNCLLNSKFKRDLFVGTLTRSSNSSDGDTGGLSVSVKDPPFNGPLLCESLPDVNGDTSC